MRTAAPHIESPDISIYWNMLKNLNEDVKLELISKLSMKVAEDKCQFRLKDL